MRDSGIRLDSSDSSSTSSSEHPLHRRPPCRFIPITSLILFQPNAYVMSPARATELHYRHETFITVRRISTVHRCSSARRRLPMSSQHVDTCHSCQFLRLKWLDSTAGKQGLSSQNIFGTVADERTTESKRRL